MLNLTVSTKPITIKSLERRWHLVDVKDKTLGRITTQIAGLLQGKHKTNYVPYLDMGDYVVVINARQIKLSGRKAQTKTYTNYSGYPGGLRITSFSAFLKRKPSEIIRRAVGGMLPKNKHRQRRLGRLYVFSGAKHPYQKELSKINN